MLSCSWQLLEYITAKRLPCQALMSKNVRSFSLLKCSFLCTWHFLRSTTQLHSQFFSQQAEVVAMEGEEYWPLGQFEPGRAAAGASQHEHEPAA